MNMNYHAQTLFPKYRYGHYNCNFHFYIGPILAFAQTIHMTASFLSPIAAGILLQESVSLKLFQFYLRH
jgi:hypothetical protein